MKKAFAILFLAIGLSLAASAQIKKVTLQAAGLTCAMCSNATLKSLETLPFVDKIETDLNTTTFILLIKPNAIVSIDAIKNKVEEAGFSVAKLTFTAGFDHVNVSKDAHVTYGGTQFHFMNVKQQVLNGDHDLTVIDQHFVSAKQFKKYSTQTTMPCYQTGVMSSCCEIPGKSNSTRIYHVTI
jgi:copper chaperone CopZ